VIACFDRLSEFDPANVEFRYLRDSLAGARVDRPPDSYIESFFDRFAPRFDARLVEELRYTAPEAAARVLAPRLAGRTGLRVVDLGCGTGLSGGFLRAHAGALVGVDLSAAMLERARERGIYDELVREEIGDYLARRDRASIDLALALDVFIYVGDLVRVLRAAAAALASGGLLVFSIEDLPGGGRLRAPAGRALRARAQLRRDGRKGRRPRAHGVRGLRNPPRSGARHPGAPVRFREDLDGPVSFRTGLGLDQHQRLVRLLTTAPAARLGAPGRLVFRAHLRCHHLHLCLHELQRRNLRRGICVTWTAAHRLVRLLFGQGVVLAHRMEGDRLRARRGRESRGRGLGRGFRRTVVRLLGLALRGRLATRRPLATHRFLACGAGFHLVEEIACLHRLGRLLVPN
jgi:SAM-dependent methyltransferase